MGKKRWLNFDQGSSPFVFASAEQQPVFEEVGHDHPWYEGHRDWNEYEKYMRSFIGSSVSDQHIMTSCVAESFVQVLLSLYMKVSVETGKNEILALETENATILTILKNFEPLGIFTTLVKVQGNGCIDIEDLQKKLNPKTLLFPFSLASPLTGVIQPMWEIARILRSHGVYSFVDVSALALSLTHQFQDIPIDYLALASEGVGAPMGISLLCAKEQAPLKPLLGVSKLQNGKRLPPIPKHVALNFVTGMKEAFSIRDTIALEMARKRAIFEEELKKKIPSVVFLLQEKRLFNVSVFAIPYIHSENLLYRMGEHHVLFALGGSREQKLAFLLQKMGIDPFLSHCAMSFSLNLFHTEEELTKTVVLLKQEAEAMGPHREVLEKENIS